MARAVAKPPAPRMSAAGVLALLAQRHARDVFVPECKMGSTWGSGAMRLDAWALRRSWSPVCAIGYEVKVSRSDWLGDDKWHSYRRAVHQMWLVAPRDVVAVEEVPEGVGLLRPTAAGRSLTTERKAVYAEPEPWAFADLLTYVVMSRTRVAANMWDANAPAAPDREQRIAEWRERLAAQDAGRAIDREVKGHIRRRMGEAAEEHARLRSQIRGFERVAELLRERGIDPEHAHDSGWWARAAVDAVAGTDPERVREAVAEAQRQLAQVAKMLEPRVAVEAV